MTADELQKEKMPEPPIDGDNGHWVKLNDPESDVKFLAEFDNDGNGGYNVWGWIVNNDEIDGRITQVVVTMINDEIHKAVAAEMHSFVQHMRNTMHGGEMIATWIRNGLDWYLGQKR